MGGKRMSKLLRHIALATLLIFVGAFDAFAGIDPHADSLSVVAVRQKMDSIRTRRPVVALVLSGGGAKGSAHIGVIRHLEELDIPVDMVLGTSMGGLVGGLLGLGYSSEDMEEIVMTADWKYLLTDKLPRSYMSYKSVKYKGMYQISIPFYYAKNDFVLRKEDAYKYVHRKYSPLSLGADKGDSKKFLKDNLWESLPQGYTFGQNVTNLFNSKIVGYADSLDFKTLPKPYFCVASDMVSFEAKRWYSGKIADAMRSTMSIPGLFAPHRVDGMVLVDGGMRDNYPVGMARELGADIVIGVELSDAKKDYTEVNNIGDILSQGIDMLGADKFRENENAADVKIKPDLHEYNMLSFDAESTGIIIQRGYDAACSADTLLRQVKALTAPYGLEFHGKKATNLSHEYIWVNEIDIRGVTDKEEEVLVHDIGIMPGNIITKDRIEHFVSRMYATGAFDYVTYEVLGSSEPYKLVINCQKGPIHQVGIGARFDTEDIVSVLVNVGLNAHKLMGSRLDFTAKVCANPVVSLRYNYVSPKFPTVNFDISARYTDLNRLNFGDKRLTLNYWDLKAEAYLSNIKFKHVDIKGGLRNEYFNLRDTVFTSQISGKYDFAQRNNDYLSLFVDARIENFDKNYFPERGLSAGVGYGWTFAGFGPGAFKNFHEVTIDGRFVVPGGKIFAFIPSAGMRMMLGKSIPVMYMNVIGGSLAGRYMNQQTPFIGINNCAPMGNILLNARTDFRFKFAKNHYVTGMFNYAHDSNSFKEFLDGGNWFGCGLEYAYNTIIGPIGGNIHWSNINNKVGFYLSIGFDF